jgi:hypothetical protein
MGDPYRHPADSKPTSGRRWVKVLAIVALIAVLIVVIIALAGGHRPRPHTLPDDAGLGRVGTTLVTGTPARYGPIEYVGG